jgi:hypothetical protein
VSTRDVLLAHRDWIPLPQQGDELDTWFSLLPAPLGTHAQPSLPQQQRGAAGGGGDADLWSTLLAFGHRRDVSAATLEAMEASVPLPADAVGVGGGGGDVAARPTLILPVEPAAITVATATPTTAAAAAVGVTGVAVRPEQYSALPMQVGGVPATTATTATATEDDGRMRRFLRACCPPFFGGGRKGSKYGGALGGSELAEPLTGGGVAEEAGGGDGGGYYGAGAPTSVTLQQTPQVEALPTAAYGSSSVGGGARSGAAGAFVPLAAPAGTRLRLKAQWVPLYAAKDALRSVRLQLHLAAVNLSVIDGTPKELLLVHLAGIAADAAAFHSGRVVLEAGVGSMLVNNQSPVTRHPMLVGPATAAAADAHGGGHGGGGGGKRSGGVPSSSAAGGGAEGLTSADVPVPLTSTSGGRGGGGAGGVSPSTGIRLRAVLENHPSVLFFTELSLRAPPMMVAVDDTLFLELLRFAASLHLTALAGSASRDEDLQATLRAQDPLARLLPGAGGGSAAGGAPSSAAGDAGTTTGFQARAGGLLDGALSLAVADLLAGLARTGRFPGAATRRDLFARPLLRPRGAPVAPDRLRGESKVYAGSLRCSPLLLDLTVSLGDDPAFLGSVLPDMGYLAIVKSFIMSVGSLVGNLDHAPLTLRAFRAAHLYETTTMLVNRLTRHYVLAAVTQFYAISEWGVTQQGAQARCGGPDTH